MEPPCDSGVFGTLTKTRIGYNRSNPRGIDQASFAVSVGLTGASLLLSHTHTQESKIHSGLVLIPGTVHAAGGSLNNHKHPQRIFVSDGVEQSVGRSPTRTSLVNHPRAFGQILEPKRRNKPALLLPAQVNESKVNRQLRRCRVCALKIARCVP